MRPLHSVQLKLSVEGWWCYPDPGRGTRLIGLFSAAGHVEPQHAEDLVEWMTKPSSSSSSSLAHAQGTLSGKAAANSASSLGSMASVTPSVAPPCPPEESLELFDHSVGYMLQEDAQRLECSDDDTELDEGSNVPKKDSNLAVMLPLLQHTARFGSVMRREGMMRSLTQRGCLIGERRRHITNEAGCPPGASLRAAH